MKILNIKEWLQLKQNAQFRFVGESRLFAHRLSDEAHFAIGTWTIENDKDLSITMNKFHENLIHVNITVCRIDKKLKTFDIEIKELHHSIAINSEKFKTANKILGGHRIYEDTVNKKKQQSKGE